MITRVARLICLNACLLIVQTLLKTNPRRNLDQVTKNSPDTNEYVDDEIEVFTVRFHIGTSFQLLFILTHL